MKSLYISDLDGTLLNKNVELSNYTIDTINALIEKGLNFTIATARTAATITSILEPLHLTIPVILMNGVIIYDIPTKKYRNIHYLPRETVSDIVTILNDNDLHAFMYEINEDVLTTYYDALENEAMYDFYEERVTRYQKQFKNINNFNDISFDNIIYFALLDTKEALEPAFMALQNHPELSVAFYKDIYTKDEIWYLEIFSKHATKYNGVKYLREHYNYHHLVGFGDNLNDIPLFKGCDESCAVANAKDELKKIASHVIVSNEEDGVAKFIETHFKS